MLYIYYDICEEKTIYYKHDDTTYIKYVDFLRCQEGCDIKCHTSKLIT